MMIIMKVSITLIALVALLITFVYIKKSKDEYSYIQYLEPEDQLRTTKDLTVEGDDVYTEEEGPGLDTGGISGAGISGAGISGCPCGALSKFEIPYYMRNSMCGGGVSDMYPGDPGYFLGRTVI